MDNTARTFKEFLATQSSPLPLGGFVVNLLLAAALAELLALFYAAYGRSLSNRRAFARNFLLVTMTTMLVISIVKSSLALSLGLVGALSIVRFRAAIKEPEELSYLFLSIGVGLGLGASQRALTLAAFPLILAVLWLARRRPAGEENPNLYLTVSARPADGRLEAIVEGLKRHAAAVALKRLEEGPDRLEAAFLLQFADFESLSRARTELRALDNGVEVHFLDSPAAP